MRDINRIEPIMIELEMYWKKNPDMRLGQIITCLCRDNSVDLFYLEDDKLYEKLVVRNVLGDLENGK